MKTLTLTFLLACGCGSAPQVPCPSEEVADYAPCGEVGAMRCESGIVYVCEPTIATCYGDDMVDGQCPTAPDGGAYRPELLGAHWMMNGWCHAPSTL